ncbi:hypothetical protein T492DRAFT_202426 [Pavlovales sp. CCMP2436]|nr:hypothetical protein T492DRAFT_202426 [Pavlovales sp. CCMP2436]
MICLIINYSFVTGSCVCTRILTDNVFNNTNFVAGPRVCARCLTGNVLISYLIHKLSQDLASALAASRRLRASNVKLQEKFDALVEHSDKLAMAADVQSGPAPLAEEQVRTIQRNTNTITNANTSTEKKKKKKSSSQSTSISTSSLLSFYWVALFTYNRQMCS